MSGGTAATATVAGVSAGVTAGTVATVADAAFMGSIAAAGSAGLGSAAAGFSLASLGTYASLAGSAISGIGAISKMGAASQSAKYNAAIAGQNATIAAENAHRAGLAGEQQAAMKEQETRAKVGQIAANQAASGIDINKGSAPDVRSSAAQNGELDAITIRSNAAREAYGYQTQGTSYAGQAKLGKQEAGYDSTAGLIDAGSTLLGGIGDTGLKYKAYQNAGGL